MRANARNTATPARGRGVYSTATNRRPWERAIAQARAEIRALIESGDLDHDEITTGWIETWAAEIYADAA